MQTMVLVRHGQTAHNRLGLIQGRTDTRLNEKGEEQARRLAGELGEVGFDAVYSSPMIRTMRTAQIITEGRSLPITADDRLLEIDQGDWTSKNTHELFRNNDRYRTWVADPTRAGPPGGETIFDVADRAKSFLEDVKGENILVVGHGGFIAVLRALLENQPLDKAWQYLPKNGEAIFITPEPHAK